jgi:hypothetical protein
MRTYPKEISAQGFSMIHRDELWILIQNENACERWYWIENENDSSASSPLLPPNSNCLLGSARSARPAKLRPQELGGSSSMQIQNTVFGKTDYDTGEVWKVTYENDTLERLIEEIQNIAVTHGFGPVDARALLRTVHGVGEDTMYIPGPNFKNNNKYPIGNLIDHDICTNFLSEDRIFVRSLIDVIFCRSSLSARDWETISLDEVVTSVEFDPELAKRKLELSYSTGLEEDDSICVIIEGYGKEPNAFIFRQSVNWVKKRLLASHKGPVSYRIEARAD